MRILKRHDEVGQGLPELVNISSGLGKIVGEFDFRFAQPAQLVDGELEAILVLIDQTLILRKSSCSKALSTSSTLSHILASSCPLRSPRVRARYGSPVFLDLICLLTTTKLEVMILFSWRVQSLM